MAANRTRRLRARLRAWLGISSQHSKSKKKNINSSVQTIQRDAQKQSSPSHQPAQPPRVEVAVVPLLDQGETPAGVLSKAIVSLSWIMAALNKGPAKSNNAESETSTVASVITNVVNTMAAVPDRVKPRRICSYHVYATTAAVASFLNR